MTKFYIIIQWLNLTTHCSETACEPEDVRKKKKWQISINFSETREIPGHIGLLKYCTLLVLPAHTSIWYYISISELLMKEYIFPYVLFPDTNKWWSHSPLATNLNSEHTKTRSGFREPPWNHSIMALGFGFRHACLGLDAARREWLAGGIIRTSLCLCHCCRTVSCVSNLHESYCSLKVPVSGSTNNVRIQVRQEQNFRHRKQTGAFSIYHQCCFVLKRNVSKRKDS